MSWCWGHFYFVFSSEMENRTLSQMCGRLYLPIFLLRIGLLTLMYIFSFMTLVKIVPLPSYYLEVFHCCFVASSLLMFKYLMMVLLNVLCTHSSKVLVDFPMYSSSDSVLPHLQQYIMWLCLVIASLSFGSINGYFQSIPSLSKCTWTQNLLQMVQQLTHRPCE